MLGIFKAVGDVVSFATGKAFPVLARLGKGKATGAGLTGLATAVALKEGAPFIGGVLNAENLVPALRAFAEVLQAVSAIVAAFGFGRKVASGS